MANVPPSTNGGSAHDFFDQTIFGTPEPQASSTVDRRYRHMQAPLDALPAVTEIKEEMNHSPAFLVNAINDMRQLTDQLGGLEDLSRGAEKMPHSKRVPGKMSSVGSGIKEEDNRRESIATESEANSSLGILKLDNMQGFSETEDMGDASQILAHFRSDPQSPNSVKEHHCLQGKENMETTSAPGSKAVAVKTEAYLKFLRNASTQKQSEERPILCDVSEHVLNCGTENRLSSVSLLSNTSSSHDMKADLRLRMQRALARRTIDRSVSSTFRMSQLSDLLDDSALSSYSTQSDVSNSDRPPTQHYNIHTTNASSHTSKNSSDGEGTFGAEHFPFSMNESNVGPDSMSSESFQPAEAALERLERDENSWRQHFDILPVEPPCSDLDGNASNNAIQHLTQNLELSTLSGIITGEVTVSSSVLDGSGKRRLSMGEYFGLRTEKLGGVSDDQSEEDRPNFGKVIKSPTRNRPHPPLVDISTNQDVSLDEVPTRDAGLNVVLNSSFGDTLEFSASGDSLDSSRRSTSNRHPESSAALMPPPQQPPPKTSVKPSASTVASHRSPVSTPRDSISCRLSTSLSLPRNSTVSPATDMDLSSLSLDSGERRSSGVASISQIANLLSEMPGGLSSRSFVDNLMKGFVSTKPKSDQRHVEKNDGSSENGHHKASRADHVVSKNAQGDQILGQNSLSHPTTQERINEWMSALNVHDHNSSLENEISLDAGSITPSEIAKAVHVIEKNEAMPPPPSRPYRQQRRSVDVGCGQSRQTVMSSRSKSVSAPVRRGQAQALTSIAYDGDESDTSFMAPPGKTQALLTSKQRVHSTPKPLSRKKLPNDVESDRRSFNATVSQGTGRECVDSHHSESDGSGDRRSLVSGRKSSLNSAHHSPRSSDSRAASACGSTKNSSRQTEASSVSGGTPLQVESTHTQLSWAAVSPGSSVTQAFALRNKACSRVRLFVYSSEPTFKLMGERGEVAAELSLSLHSEETRRIHVMFTPSSIGPVIGKLVVRRLTTSENTSTSSGERRLIPLYGYCGNATVIVEGASKDQWAQLFVNIGVIDTDERSEISIAESATDVPQLGASFFVRNTGSVPAFASLQIAAHEVPFSDCGVSIMPSHVVLAPGQVNRVTVRFEPNHDVLQWLLTHAGDVQLLANVWISWAELSTWQRIRRLFLKHYGDGVAGPLASWGPLYTGDLGDARELRDRQSAETILVQGVRRVKMAVLGEREQLRMFDLDATLVFQQLVANETIMLHSPPVDVDAERPSDATVCEDSPLLAGNLDGIRKNRSFNDSPSGRSEIKSQSGLVKPFKSNEHEPVWASRATCNISARNIASMSHEEKDPLKKEETSLTSDTLPIYSDSYIVEFPPTVLGHKSCAKVAIKNTSLQKHHVSVCGATNPFSVATPEFDIQGHWYINLRVFFKPQTAGPAVCALQVFIDGKHTLNYSLKGEGVKG